MRVAILNVEHLANQILGEGGRKGRMHCSNATHHEYHPVQSNGPEKLAVLMEIDPNQCSIRVAAQL